MSVGRALANLPGSWIHFNNGPITVPNGFNTFLMKFNMNAVGAANYWLDDLLITWY